MSAVLRVAELACGYGETRILSGLSLDVAPGEVLALIGPNGSGKTTLLHTLAGLLPPQAGDVAWDGRSLLALGRRERARVVALAPQRAEEAAWPLTVREAVALGRAPHRGWFRPLTAADDAVVERSMERLGVTNLSQRLLPTLSGGELRRVLLARALAQSPRVLLLDEPASFLDLHYQAELLGIVRRLALEERVAVVLTVHDLALVAAVADRVALLAHGRLQGVGTPGEILSAERLVPVFGPHLEVLAHPRSGGPLVLPRLPGVR
jgi:iron complex transport system ATP-binding protein